MNDYKKLIIWKKAMQLCVLTYELTDKMPQSELYGLASQIKRAVISVPSNIAEGAGRNNPGEFRQFLSIAYGSLCELQTQLMLARKLKMINLEDFNNVNTCIEEIMKMSFSLQKKLETLNQRRKTK